jgi:hypothetical protein
MEMGDETVLVDGYDIDIAKEESITKDDTADTTL